MSDSVMPDVATLSEQDLALVAALEAAPRGAWAHIAQVTGMTTATVARHWQRLSADGTVWSTAGPGRAVWSTQCLSLVEVHCSPGNALRIARILAEDGRALTVEITTGNADILLTVLSTDPAALSRYVLERLGRIPGITGTTTHIVTGRYRDGANWRASTLPHTTPLPSAPRPPGDRASAPPARMTDVDRLLLLRLGLDGRSTFAELAAAAAVSEATARRRTDRLIRTGLALPRTEAAAPAVGWPVSAVLFIDAPIRTLTEAARAAARNPQVRLAAITASTPGLAVVAWLRHVGHIHALEQDLLRQVPQLEIARQMIVLRTLKRMGRILDADGRAVRAVPMDYWSEATPTAR